MNPTVSVTICVRDGEKYVGDCMKSLLAQTFKDFEIVIVDDASNDNTSQIIKGFENQRIKYLRNKEWLGITKSRNKGLKYATGKYIFFTDADCTVSKDWIEQGLKCLVNDCVGVEGRIIYVSTSYRPTFSDNVQENTNGGQFMTGNAAYRRSVLDAVGGFDEKIAYLADRDLGLRIKKHGRICFNANMIAFHPQVILTPSRYVKSAPHIENRVYLFKRFGEKESVFWRIVSPFNLAKIFCPELVLATLFFRRFKKKEDFKLLPYTYVFAVLERLYLWKTCAKERVFLI